MIDADRLESLLDAILLQGHLPSAAETLGPRGAIAYALPPAEGEEAPAPWRLIGHPEERTPCGSIGRLADSLWQEGLRQESLKPFLAVADPWANVVTLAWHASSTDGPVRSGSNGGSRTAPEAYLAELLVERYLEEGREHHGSLARRPLIQIAFLGSNPAPPAVRRGISQLRRARGPFLVDVQIRWLRASCATGGDDESVVRDLLIHHLPWLPWPRAELRLSAKDIEEISGGLEYAAERLDRAAQALPGGPDQLARAHSMLKEAGARLQELSDRRPSRTPWTVEQQGPPANRPLWAGFQLRRWCGAPPVSLHLAPMTFVLGENATGKTTLAEALCLAHTDLPRPRVRQPRGSADWGTDASLSIWRLTRDQPSSLSRDRSIRRSPGEILPLFAEDADLGLSTAGEVAAAAWLPFPGVKSKGPESGATGSEVSSNLVRLANAVTRIEEQLGATDALEPGGRAESEGDKSPAPEMPRWLREQLQSQLEKDRDGVLEDLRRAQRRHQDEEAPSRKRMSDEAREAREEPAPPTEERREELRESIAEQRERLEELEREQDALEGEKPKDRSREMLRRLLQRYIRALEAALLQDLREWKQSSAADPVELAAFSKAVDRDPGWVISPYLAASRDALAEVQRRLEAISTALARAFHLDSRAQLHGRGESRGGTDPPPGTSFDRFTQELEVALSGELEAKPHSARPNTAATVRWGQAERLARWLPVAGVEWPLLIVDEPSLAQDDSSCALTLVRLARLSRLVETHRWAARIAGAKLPSGYDSLRLDRFAPSEGSPAVERASDSPSYRQRPEDPWAPMAPQVLVLSFRNTTLTTAAEVEGATLDHSTRAALEKLVPRSWWDPLAESLKELEKRIRSFPGNDQPRRRPSAEILKTFWRPPLGRLRGYSKLAAELSNSVEAIENLGFDGVAGQVADELRRLKGKEASAGAEERGRSEFPGHRELALRLLAWLVATDLLPATLADAEAEGGYQVAGVSLLRLPDDGGECQPIGPTRIRRLPPAADWLPPIPSTWQTVGRRSGEVPWRVDLSTQGPVAPDAEDLFRSSLLAGGFHLVGPEETGDAAVRIRRHTDPYEPSSRIDWQLEVEGKALDRSRGQLAPAAACDQALRALVPKQANGRCWRPDGTCQRPDHPPRGGTGTGRRG